VDRGADFAHRAIDSTREALKHDAELARHAVDRVEELAQKHIVERTNSWLQPPINRIHGMLQRLGLGTDYSRPLAWLVFAAAVWGSWRYLIHPRLRRLRWSSTHKLDGRVAIVTGASRGVGKGIAIALAEAGATVYVTGRTTDAGSADASSGENSQALPGTINETAQLCTRAGGHGIAVRCDHSNDHEIEELMQRVISEQGHLDILVNNVMDRPIDSSINAQPPFWESLPESSSSYNSSASQVAPAREWDDFMRTALRGHYISSSLAARHMVQQKTGLIVNISSWGAAHYFGGVQYGVAKAGLDKMARDMAHELQPHGVSAISLWPGIVKTERTMAVRDSLRSRAGVDLEDLGETGTYTGRAIVALAADKHTVQRRSGQVFQVADLAWEYGFTDADGRQPPAVGSTGFALQSAWSIVKNALHW